MSPEPTVYDVEEADFERRVIARSSELPVVVDFWAAWCGPCKQLTPALERAANARAGKVELAKVDVDANPRLQSAFRIQGYPPSRRSGRPDRGGVHRRAAPGRGRGLLRLAGALGGGRARRADEPALRRAPEL